MTTPRPNPRASDQPETTKTDQMPAYAVHVGGVNLPLGEGVKADPVTSGEAEGSGRQVLRATRHVWGIEAHKQAVAANRAAADKPKVVVCHGEGTQGDWGMSTHVINGTVFISPKYQMREVERMDAWLNYANHWFRPDLRPADPQMLDLPWFMRELCFDRVAQRAGYKDKEAMFRAERAHHRRYQRERVKGVVGAWLRGRLGW